METLLDEQENNIPDQKTRHGCVTTWLILIIVFNSLALVMNTFFNSYILRNLPNASFATVFIQAVMAGINVIAAIALLRWKKIGFWGFVCTSLATFAVNVSIGFAVIPATTGLLGAAILFGILQIKQDGKSAWELME
ncbi:MAG: hypothetical protein AAFX87_20080 [Bacteroidota bacterium]